MTRLLTLLLFAIGPLLACAQSDNARIDSMVRRLASLQEDTGKAMLLTNIAYTYANIDPAKGKEHAQQAEVLATKLKWKPGIASAYSAMALNYSAQSDFTNAIDYHLRSLRAYEQAKLRNSAAGVRSNLSLIYKEQGDYPKALQYAFDALGVKEEFHDTLNIANIEENIGSIYLEQKLYDKAIFYYKKALSTHKQLHNDHGIARSLGNIGIIYGARGAHDSALLFHTEALKINETLGTKYSMQINHANIGLAFQNLKEYQRALQHHFTALKISEELGNKSNIAINLGNIGSSYLDIANNITEVKPGKQIPAGKNANIQLAISYLQKAVDICKELNLTGPQIEFTRGLSDAYLLAGRHREALEAHKEHSALKDSVFSIQNRTNIEALETKRAIELRDRDLAIKQKQLQIDKLAVEKKRNERVIFILFIALLVVIVLAIGKRARDYWRLNKRLKTESSSLALQLEAITAREKKKKEVLEEIAHIQSHDIRGPVATILGLSQLFNPDDPADPDNKAIIDGITSIAEQLDAVIKDVVSKKNELGQEEH